MDENQGGQIDADSLQQVGRVIAKGKMVKEYQDLFATMLTLPIPASTNHLEYIKNKHPCTREQLAKYQLKNDIGLNFYDSFNYSMSFDSQSLIDQSQQSQIQDTEQRQELIEIYEHYYPIHASPEQIITIVESLEKAQKNLVGMQFIDQVYQQYLLKGGKIQYEQFWQKLRADTLFLLRKNNLKQETGQQETSKEQNFDGDSDQQNSEDKESNSDSDDDDEEDSASSSTSGQTSSSSSHSSASDSKSEQET